MIGGGRRGAGTTAAGFSAAGTVVATAAAGRSPSPLQAASTSTRASGGGERIPTSYYGRARTGKQRARPAAALIDWGRLARAKPTSTAAPAPAPASAPAATATDIAGSATPGDASDDASIDIDTTDDGAAAAAEGMIRVRRIHRRDLNRVWEFLKRVFRLVNRETVEYQRPRTKTRFLEIYEEEGIEQLLFEIREGNSHSIVGYAECAYEVVGSDSWINERYFSNRDMRPLFVEEIAIHPGYQGLGIGSFVIEQLEHLARLRGCTHLVLEVAENNNKALSFYRARSFYQLDAAIFLAKKLTSEPELLPPRPLRAPRPTSDAAAPGPADAPNRKPRRPAKSGRKDSPTKSVPKDSPAKPVPKDSSKKPAKPVPKDSPAKSVPKDSPAKPVPKDSPAKPVPKDSPAPRVRLARALAPPQPAARARKRGDRG